MAQQTLINGNRHSFTSISVQLAGIDQPRVFLSINYDAQKDPGVVQANQVTPAGLTSGYAQGSGSFEMLDSELDDFFNELTAGGLFNVMDVDFDVVVQYSENAFDTRTDTLRGCRITKVSKANSAGNNAAATTCDLFIRRALRNGIPLYGDPTL